LTDRDGWKELKNVIKDEASLLIAMVSKILTERGIGAYVVGGFVRDLLLGRDTVDIDIAVASDALEIASEVATALGGKYVLLDKVNRVARVVLDDKDLSLEGGQCKLDFSTFEGSIEQDLARRDFTVNTIAVDIRQLRKDNTDIPLIDPFKGVDDLRRGIIRAVDDMVFESDAVRLLRAVRLAIELGFSIDKRTETLIQRYSNLIAGVAGERIREELLRVIAISHSEQLITYLDELGLVTAMIPELVEARGVEQPKEHFWNVFDHSLKSVAAADFVLRLGAWEYADEQVLAITPWSEVLAEHFAQGVSAGSTRRLLFKLAALLHDIAKPQTKASDANGRMRFLGHAKDGAAMAAGILERLRFSTKEVKLVEIMVRSHLRPGQMSHDKLPSQKAIYRYFRDTGKAGIDILFLSMADHLATRGPRLNLAQWREHAQMVEYVLSEHFEQKSLTPVPKLVNGRDLISTFGMSQGPEIGKLLEIIHEAQAAGELTTKQEAMAYIRDSLLTKAG